eukprot:gene17623-19377_t
MAHERTLKNHFSSEGSVVNEAINRFASCSDDIFTSTQLLQIYNAVQSSHDVTLKHVEAAIMQVTCMDTCDRDDVIDVLQELDRRNYLLRDLKWEFHFFDNDKQGCITEDRAYYLFCAVHGKELRKVWDKFIAQRPTPGSKISFDEISVILCDIIVE